MLKSDSLCSENSVRFSVVVPTFQRRELVVKAVRSLAQQSFAGRFEIIVVVDGATDGSAQALRALELSVPLTVIEQLNQGRATALNSGAARARGEILLFLDERYGGAILACWRNTTARIVRGQTLCWGIFQSILTRPLGF